MVPRPGRPLGRRDLLGALAPEQHHLVARGHRAPRDRSRPRSGPWSPCRPAGGGGRRRAPRTRRRTGPAGRRRRSRAGRSPPRRARAAGGAGRRTAARRPRGSRTAATRALSDRTGRRRRRPGPPGPGRAGQRRGRELAVEGDAAAHQVVAGGRPGDGPGRVGRVPHERPVAGRRECGHLARSGPSCPAVKARSSGAAPSATARWVHRPSRRSTGSAATGGHQGRAPPAAPPPPGACRCPPSRARRPCVPRRPAARASAAAASGACTAWGQPGGHRGLGGVGGRPRRATGSARRSPPRGARPPSSTRATASPAAPPSRAALATARPPWP